ncbi:MAG: DNA mismatch endonuclease Vsr [Bacteroidetes bacterium]|nr:DNA mismatch endonuclease Vsr [Bacteroidota bacterium]
MTDVHTQAQRSYNMSRIRSKNTKPEMAVRKFLFASGFRYRLYVKTLPGKPDIVLRKHKTVIFIHGCFWHGHENCRHFVIPKTRTDWWLAKINRNKENDLLAKTTLEQTGWKVITIWECELKKDLLDLTLNSIPTKLQ